MHKPTAARSPPQRQSEPRLALVGTGKGEGYSWAGSRKCEPGCYQWVSRRSMHRKPQTHTQAALRVFETCQRPMRSVNVEVFQDLGDASVMKLSAGNPGV